MLNHDNAVQHPCLQDFKGPFVKYPDQPISGIAFLVANNAYPRLTNEAQLKNAINDTTVLCHHLYNSNFSVSILKNKTSQYIRDHLDQIAFSIDNESFLSHESGNYEFRRLVVYVAGHGFQYRNRNFFAASDFDGTLISDEYPFPTGAMLIDEIEDAFAAAMYLRDGWRPQELTNGKSVMDFGIIIVDACREDLVTSEIPILDARGWAEVPPKRRDAYRSLRRWYSTSSGQLAYDKHPDYTDNGRFMAILSDKLQLSRLSIHRVEALVEADMMGVNAQRPDLPQSPVTYQSSGAHWDRISFLPAGPDDQSSKKLAADFLQFIDRQFPDYTPVDNNLRRLKAELEACSQCDTDQCSACDMFVAIAGYESGVIYQERYTPDLWQLDKIKGKSVIKTQHPIFTSMYDWILRDSIANTIVDLAEQENYPDKSMELLLSKRRIVDAIGIDKESLFWDLIARSAIHDDPNINSKIIGLIDKYFSPHPAPPFYR